MVARFFQVLFLILALPEFTGAQELRAQIRLYPDDFVALGDEVVLEIKISTLRPDLRISDPEFRLDNLEILSGPDRASSLRMVDGKPAAGRTLTWRLKARKTGMAKVYNTRIEVEDRRVNLPDRSVEVLRELPRESFDRGTRPEGEPPWSRNSARRDDARERSASTPEIFLRADVSNTNPWVGEQVVYRLNLYTQVDIDSVSPENIPSFKGFWVRVIPQPDDLKTQMVEVDGQRFGKVILLERALFPRRAGTLEIGPVTARMQAQGASGSPFSSGRKRSREIRRDSNGLKIQVRELPTPPETLESSFHGAVGRLQWIAELEPKSLAVGEAATWTLTLRGEGHLQGIPAPEMPLLEDLEIFPPQQKSDEELVDKVLRGDRTWSFVVVPGQEGIRELPAVELTVFDPRRGEYKKLSTLPLQLQVAPAPENQNPTNEATLPASEAPENTESQGSGKNLLRWALAVPLLLLLAAGAWFARRHRPREGDPHLELLQALALAEQESKPRPAAARIETAWRDYLEKRWEISQDVVGTLWQDKLKECGVPESFTAELHQIAEDLHYLRYAPKLSPSEDLLKEILQRSRKLAKKR